MTVANATATVTHTGNGSTTIWSYSFYIGVGEVEVSTEEIATGIITTLSASQYTFTPDPDFIGGTITYPKSGTPLPATHYIHIARVTPRSQLLQLTNQGAFNPNLLEDAFDKLTRITQELTDTNGSIIDAVSAAASASASLAAALSAAQNAISSSLVARFATVAAFLADNNTLIGYSGSGATITVTAGVIIEAGGFRYSIRASDASDHDVATAGSVKADVLRGADGTFNAAAFGCDTGAANNAAALASLYAAADAVTFDEFYPVTGNFARVNIPHYGVGGVTISSVDIPLSTQFIDADVTVYVDASGGSDSANHGLTAAYPFATIGRALQSVPARIGTGVTYLVEVADGTYTTSAVSASDMARPALIYLSGVKSDRSASDGSNLTGGVVIRGESKAGTIIRAGTTYTYGAYATQATNLGLQDLTIDTGGACQALITGHRASYIQTLNVDVTGSTNAQNCIVAEACGTVECTGNGALTGAVTTVNALAESQIVLANTGSASGGSNSTLGGKGTIRIVNTFSVSGTVSMEGGNLDIRGTDTSNRVTISAAITAYDTEIAATWANLSGQCILYDCRTNLNACGFSNAVFVRGGEFYLRGNTTTYIAPASASTVANPVILQNGAIYGAASGTVYAGSGGATGPSRNIQAQSITANSQAITLLATSTPHETKTITSTGAHTGITIATTFSDNSLAPAQGDKITLRFSGSNSAALSTSGIDINGGGVTLGKGGGQYGSITFVWTGALWSEIARSAAN